jgi:hypothetical protein
MPVGHRCPSPSRAVVLLALLCTGLKASETDAALQRMSNDITRLTTTENSAREAPIANDDARLIKDRLAQNSNAGGSVGAPGRPTEQLRRLGDLPPKDPRQQREGPRIVQQSRSYTNPDSIREEQKPLDGRRRLVPELPGDQVRQRHARERWRAQQAVSSSLPQTDETATPLYMDASSGLRRPAR